MKKSIFLAMFALVALSFSSVAQQKEINTSVSIIKWTGKKVTGEHTGTIALKSGHINLAKGKINAGEFIVDMTSITNTDLPAGEWNDKLIGHLKSDDFFGVATYPEAKLLISSVAEKEGQETVTGLITIKGISQIVNFVATKTDTGYKTTLTLDRTKFGIKYGSGQFFEGLGDKMIYDEFTLDITIVLK